MKHLKKIWKAQVKILSGNKLDLDAESPGIKIRKTAGYVTPETPYGTAKKSIEKPISLRGAYFSSHPDIHNQKGLKLEFTTEGVTVYGAKKNTPPIKEFKWSEIIGYSEESIDQSHIDKSQRITATRMATLGVFALAAPKQKNNSLVKSKFYDVICTTTGDIELETQINSGTAGGGIGDISRSVSSMLIAKHEKITREIKRIVAERATGKISSITNDPTDQLVRLAKLRNDGILTNEEFDTKKKQILGID